MELKIKSWDNVTLSTYNKIEKIMLSSDDEIDKNIQIISLLADADEDEIADLPLSEFQRLIGESSFLATPPKVTQLISTKYILNGVEYDLQTNLELMTAKQYMDFKQYSVDYSRNRKYLIACFLLPKGVKKYSDGYDVGEVAKAVEEHMGMVEVMRICNFFLQRYRALTVGILSLQVKKMKREMKREKDMEKRKEMMKAVGITQQYLNSLKNGDGSIL